MIDCSMMASALNATQRGFEVAHKYSPPFEIAAEAAEIQKKSPNRSAGGAIAQAWVECVSLRACAKIAPCLPPWAGMPLAGAAAIYLVYKAYKNFKHMKPPPKVPTAPHPTP